MDWHKCRFLESSENLKPLVRERFGREPSTSIARQISACLQQGRLFYEAAASSPLEIRPLQQFYGTVGFSKALVVARRLCSLSSLRPAHGIQDISTPNSRIADLRLKIGEAGTFQEFNDVIAELAQVYCSDSFANIWTVPLPSTKANQLSHIELSLREILSRISGLESLYQMTFGEDANSASFLLMSDDGKSFKIEVTESRVFTDRQSLRQIVDGWRTRFPFLRMWRLESTVRAWGYSTICFVNTGKTELDEFSELYLVGQGSTFQAVNVPVGNSLPLEQALYSIGGGVITNSPHAISPVNGLSLSEFSLHYLSLFLLSSLVRYRPQIWAYAISRSVTSEEPADDQALSLIQRFLDLNMNVIPDMVVKVLNPHEECF
jgi:hypothetical protein